MEKLKLLRAKKRDIIKTINNHTEIVINKKLNELGLKIGDTVRSSINNKVGILKTIKVGYDYRFDFTCKGIKADGTQSTHDTYLMCRLEKLVKAESDE